MGGEALCKSHGVARPARICVPLLAIFVFLALALEARAAVCAPHPVHYVAVCESGVCQRGFEVEYVATGNSPCGLRPEVNTAPEHLSNVFAFVRERIGGEPLTDGIYQIDSNRSCLPPRSFLQRASFFQDQETLAFFGEEEVEKDKQYWDESCLGTRDRTVVRQLSTDASEESLGAFFRDWKKAERLEYGETFLKKWGSISLIVFLAFAAIIWPWYLLWERPPERKNLRWIYAAFSFQATLALFYAIILGISPYDFSVLWMRVVLWAFIALAASLAAAVLYVVSEKVRALPPKNPED